MSGNSNNNFGKINLPIPNRTKFNMSNTHITSANFGQLIPIFTQEMNPSDSINLDSKVFIQQASPLATPCFGSLRASVKHFFVPYRIIYPSWEKFITGGSTGTIDSELPLMNGLEASLICASERFSSSVYSALGGPVPRGGISALVSNLGLSPLIKFAYDHRDHIGYMAYDFLKGKKTDLESYKRISELTLNIMPFRAYQQIWWDYYRDSKLVTDDVKRAYVGWPETGISNDLASLCVDDGQQFTAFYAPTGWDVDARSFLTRYACYDKDYFTTASLYPQITQSPSSISSYPFISNEDFVPTYEASSGSYTGYYSDSTTKHDANDGSYKLGLSVMGTASQTATAPAVKLVKSQFTIEDIRQADALQRFLERKNISGGRYIQQLFSQFGVKAPAERLDMAEFLGDDTFNIDFNGIVNTSAVSDGDALGTKGATMQGYGHSPKSYTAVEHGLYMAILDIMPVVNYSQGIDPLYSHRMSKEDYFLPEFENTGFEAIRKGELYCDYTNNDNNPNAVFGYTPRYASMKWKPSIIGGDFSNNATNGQGLMDAWNTNRLFVSEPNLNSNFVWMGSLYYADGDATIATTKQFNRIFTNTSNDIDHFYLNIFNQCTMVRPMSPLGAPDGLVNDKYSTLNIPFGGVRVN